MKTTFHYDLEAAIAQCCGYSDSPETLKSLIARLDISVGAHTVIPSPWNRGIKEMKALHMMVTTNGYSFAYHGSHVDAEAMGSSPVVLGAQLRERKRARDAFRNNLLYSILCCVKSDLCVLDESPEDLGYNSDSIVDMAKWNEIKAHAKKTPSSFETNW